MSKPKNMTPEQEAAWREKRRAQAAKYYAANPEKIRARNAAWVAANRERVRELRAKYYAANPEKARARRAAWVAANPEKARRLNAANRAANIESMSDSYVAGLLGLPVAECPKGLIEVKREHLKLARLLKELKDEEC